MKNTLEKSITNISYSFGMVDLLHYGHIRALKKARVGADLCIFGLVSDDASDAWFGNHVSNEQERKDVLEGIRYIDLVMPQRTFDPTENLRSLHEKYPDAVLTLYHGNDWRVIPAQKYLESIRGRVVTFDYYEKLSPKNIVDALNRDNVSNKPCQNLISTKANTLLALQEQLMLSKIEPIAVFTVGQFQANSSLITKQVQEQFAHSPIVVRSSSTYEDAFESSNAGHFHSVLNVNADDPMAILSAFSQVIDSYRENAGPDQQILVQRQTTDVILSGVVFTRDIQRNRPYYVINYDDNGSTDSVTSGLGGSVVWISHDVEESSIPSQWKCLVFAVREIEQILTDMLLDIEFAITSSKQVVIFQVRPLAAGYKFGRKSNVDMLKVEKKKQQIFYQSLCEQGLSLFSDMAFWNPSEIIGDNPKNLDFSLYQYIITSHAWNDGLVTMGYSPVNSDLMVKFGNKPYISLDLSFRALTPADLSRELQEKLCRYYVRNLRENRSSHDKIEFEIVLNCFHFSIDKSLLELEANGFTHDEAACVRKALFRLTRAILLEYPDILERDLHALKQLEQIRLSVEEQLQNTPVRTGGQLANSIKTLLNSLNQYGTPHFSRQARCAFMAKSFCISLMKEHYITSEEYHLFLSSIQTVAAEFERDFRAFTKGKLPEGQFLSRYGHLRAGTYDIRSKRYDQMDFITEHVSWGITVPPNGEEVQKPEPMLSPVEVWKALNDYGLEDISYDSFLFFLKTSLEQREYFKFIFTKTLSYAIELIKELGQTADIPVKDLSYLEVPEILSAEYYPPVGLHDFWGMIIEKRKEQYKKRSELILPSVIGSAADFDFIENTGARPNFVTEKSVTAFTLVLEDMDTDDISGKIVVLEKADPGYDWIFSKNIAGLITKYGGAASHMAIRCAEFSIPAAIGCGESIYHYVKSTAQLTLDCKHEKILAVYEEIVSG